jgi:hypothetical protein
MRFMILVKASPGSEVPDESVITAMADYHEQLAKAGVLLDAAGLQPSARGWRIRHADGRRVVIDGPFAEASELVAAYTLIQVHSREEALEWTRRFPALPGQGAGAEIEVRQLFEVDDFGDSVAAGRFCDATNLTR